MAMQMHISYSKTINGAAILGEPPGAGTRRA